MFALTLPLNRLDREYLLYCRELRRQRRRNLGICYEPAKKLERLNLDWRAGITVQVLASDPYCPTVFRWAHNKLEKKSTRIARYNYKPKPDGWGNGGGGLEKFIYVPKLGKYLTELEILAMRHSGHPILANDSLSEEIKIILAGGLREFVDETGFRDIEIKTDYPGVFLLDYKYPPWIDANGIVCRGGHRKITLWGKLTSYREDPIVEVDEIDRTSWFDTELSLPSLFFNIAPERPYVSHVRSLLLGILAIYRYEKKKSNGFIPNIPKRIHQSWWYSFQVGKGDSRFPRGGYKLSPREWYHLFDLMVAGRMKEADNDFLVRFLGVKLENALRKEEERLAYNESDHNTDDAAGTQQMTKAVDDSEDAEGVPTVEEITRREDEEYCRWFEESLPEEKRVIRPVA